MIVVRPKCALALLLGVVLTAGVSPAGALWPASGGGPLNDSAFATVTDQSGNIYVAGEFRGIALFGGTAYSSEGLSDLFVAKYSPSGALLYVRTAGGPSVDRATALAVDAAQNVYLTGYFTTSAAFKNLPSSGVATVNLPDTGNGDTPDRHEWFIARLLTNGDWAWARQIGGAGQDEGYGIAIAPGSRGSEQSDRRRRDRRRTIELPEALRGRRRRLTHEPGPPLRQVLRSRRAARHRGQLALGPRGR